MNDPKRQPGPVFICYAHEDEDMALRLCTDLKNHRADVWIDKENLVAGEDYDLAIRKAIESCSYFLLILSETSVNKKGYVNREIRKALDVLDTFPEGGRFILPVRKNDCETSYERLQRLHQIDMFPNYSQGLKLLLESLGIQQMQHVKRFPDHKDIQSRIDDHTGVQRYYVTPLGDVIIFNEITKTSDGWKHKDQNLILVEWDFLNCKYKTEQIIGCGHSYGQYYIGGGTDVYHDEIISNVRFDYSSNLMSWDRTVRDEEENEWTADYELLKEEKEHHVYDTIRRQLLNGSTCSKCGAPLAGRR